MELQPCAACHRHIATDEAACPFCGRAVAAATPQHVLLRGRVSRAAVFSAALAACGGSHDDPPARQPPAPEVAPEPLDRDFNELLGPATPTGGASRSRLADAATADAALADAAVDAAADAAVDAGVDPQEAERRRLRRLERQRVERELLEKQRLFEQQRLFEEQHQRNACCKPYGAPPARRRLV